MYHDRGLSYSDSMVIVKIWHDSWPYWWELGINSPPGHRSWWVIVIRRFTSKLFRFSCGRRLLRAFGDLPSAAKAAIGGPRRPMAVVGKCPGWPNSPTFWTLGSFEGPDQPQMYSTCVCWFFQTTCWLFLYFRTVVNCKENPHVQQHSPPTKNISQTYMEHLKQKFAWMAKEVPCFGIKGTNVHVLNEPIDFYESFKVRPCLVFYPRPKLLLRILRGFCGMSPFGHIVSLKWKLILPTVPILKFHVIWNAHCFWPKRDTCKKIEILL